MIAADGRGCMPSGNGVSAFGNASAFNTCGSASAIAPWARGPKSGALNRFNFASFTARDVQSGLVVSYLAQRMLSSAPHGNVTALNISSGIGVSYIAPSCRSSVPHTRDIHLIMWPRDDIDSHCFEKSKR